jgi:hypothetical protein
MPSWWPSWGWIFWLVVVLVVIWLLNAAGVIKLHFTLGF